MLSFKSLGALALAMAPVLSSAAVNSIDVNNSALWTESKGTTSSANYGFDYSNLGIPLAPGKTTASALRLRANVGTPAGAGTAQGITLTPAGLNLTGDYKVSAKVWMNSFGAFTNNLSAGAGSTQFFGLGGGYTSGTNYRAGATTGGGSGTWFAVAGEGGFGATSTTIRDYNAFTGSGNASANFVTASSAYEASKDGLTNAQDHQNAYYAGIFPQIDAGTIYGGDLAAKQNAIATAQKGTASTPQSGTISGAPLFAWRDFVIERVGTTMTFSIDGNKISTLSATSNGTPLTLNGGLSMTYFDATSGISEYPELNFALVSDYTVTTPDPVPEPAGLGLIGLGLLSLAGRRNRR